MSYKYYGPSTRSIARFTVAISSAREWRGSCTAITLWPAFSRIEITLLHEDHQHMSHGLEQYSCL